MKVHTIRLRNTNQHMRKIKLLLCDWKFNIEGCNLEDQKMITYKLYNLLNSLKGKSNIQMQDYLLP